MIYVHALQSSAWRFSNMQACVEKIFRAKRNVKGEKEKYDGKMGKLSGNLRGHKKYE